MATAPLYLYSMTQVNKTPSFVYPWDAKSISDIVPQVLVDRNNRLFHWGIGCCTPGWSHGGFYEVYEGGETVFKWIRTSNWFVWPRRCTNHSTTHRRFMRRLKMRESLLDIQARLEDIPTSELHPHATPRFLTLTHKSFVPYDEESIRLAKQTLLKGFTKLRRKHNFTLYVWAFEFKGFDRNSRPKLDASGNHVCNPHLHILYWGDYWDIDIGNELCESFGLGRPNIKVAPPRRTLNYLLTYMGKQDNTFKVGPMTKASLGKAQSLFQRVDAHNLVKTFQSIDKSFVEGESSPKSFTELFPEYEDSVYAKL